MPDLFLSTKHPLQPARLNTSIKLHHGIPPGGAICSSLLIFPEMFQVLLDRMTPN
jgi:hypothetical protein